MKRLPLLILLVSHSAYAQAQSQQSSIYPIGSGGGGSAVGAITCGAGNFVNKVDTVSTCGTPTAGANTALSNLASVAINADLLPGTSGTRDLGSATLHFNDLFAGTATNAQYIRVTHDGSDGVISSATGSVSIPSSNSNSLQVGSGASVIADGGTALGWHAGAGGVHAVAIGDGAGAEGITTIAIGGNAGATLTASQSYGYSASSTAAHQITFGCDGCTYGEADQFRVIGTAPTITAGCGTSPSLVGSATAGKLNVGTGGTATNCTLTFPTAFTTAPSCIVQDETTILAVRGTSTTTTLVITAALAFTASDIVSYICIAGK